MSGVDSPSLFIGIFVGVVIASFGALALLHGPAQGVPDTGMMTSGPAVIDLEKISSDTFNYIEKNFLEPQGLEGKIINATEFGDDMVELTLEVTTDGRVMDSAPVYVTRDGQYLFIQPPLDTSQDLNVPTPTESPPSVQPTADDDPYRGDADAPVVIIEFSDYQCPYCGAAMGTNDGLISQFKAQDPTWEPAIPNIVKDYVDTGKVKLVFRDFPLSFHENAQKAAEAADCAGEQGKYWEYHDLLFENQEALGVDNLKGYATDLGLDTASFDQCLDTGKYTSEVQADLADGAEAGVSGTPAYFINGVMVSGAQPYSVFKQIIEAELAK